METNLSAGETNYSNTETVFVNALGCSVMSNRKVVGVVGVDDLVVVDTADALLICRRGETQEVKQIIHKQSR